MTLPGRTIAERHGVDPRALPDDLLGAGEPVVLRGAAAEWPLVQAARRSPQVAIEKKPKEKTRGAAVESEVTTAIPADDHALFAPPVQYTIKKRSMKVFRTLFFDPESGGSPGEIAWIDFLAAMSALDFRIEKLDGSAWSFSHSNLGSIQIHAPHPSPKMSYNETRYIGRRLTRNFGWTIADFLQEE